MRKARRASQSPIPYWDRRVVFVWRDRSVTGTHLRFAVAKEDKLDLLRGRRRKIYCVWPGEKESHLFVIDNLDYAYTSLARQELVYDDPRRDDKLTTADEATWG